MSPLIVIVGPTASGKSDFAMRIAQKYGGEIICADSRTVYKGMDIGTAKPSKQDRVSIKHHLLDVVEPGELFTAADFKRLANQAINEIWGRGKWPIMVGGSGLYIDAVLFDYSFGPRQNEARNRLDQKSVPELQDICAKQSIPLPENSGNKRYLIRAIELGGLLQQNNQIRPNTIVVGMATEKEELQKRISARATIMVKQGIVDEVRRISAQVAWDSEPMKGNIYRIFRQVIEGTQTVPQALDEFVKSDWRLVKKQITWFKRNPHIVWGKPEQLEQVVNDFVQSQHK